MPLTALASSSRDSGTRTCSYSKRRARTAPACDLVVCTGEARHVYSGMVPGWLSGQYTIDELSIDVAAAVRAAGGTLVPAHVTAIDPRARTLTLADGTTVPYDVCSIAVGSQVRGRPSPGGRACGRGEAVGGDSHHR
ncbi:MAG: hypothetical protein IPF47_13935 [Gemmatimonadetes bacterium]|nr:hypothetical protein [Gemmatimonadota bacterium]